MMKKRIVMLGNTASTLLNFRYELIKKLVEEGNDVYCMVREYNEQQKKQVELLGAKFIPIKLNSKGINPVKDIAATWQLRNLIKTINPDVVFSYFVKPVIFGTFAARLAGVKRCVGMIEGLGNAFTPSCDGFSCKTRIIQWIQVLLYKLALPRLDKLIVLNRDDKHDLVDKYNINVDTVVLGGIGVDLKKFAFTPVKPDQSIAFIFVARLLREKGIFEFLAAAKDIYAKFPQVRFYVLGGFEDNNPFALRKAELDRYLDLGIVEYPGHVDNIADWLKRASVFVLPSFYREGVPRSTQEAMAIGRPVITTDVPGCRDTVQDGYNGFLVPPHNSEALVETMEKLIQSPKLIAEMGIASRQLAERYFDINEVNQRISDLMLGQ